jgi:hypothetical protein
MIALDFFLYDNRTWSPRWGRDWGLKAATGVLANRADLKAAFDKYCGAMPGGQGQLHGFGEAIGGVRSPNRDGYLLCVTLESSDSFGRPSWAVFGLWCPDTTLVQVLSAGDPIGSARLLLGDETPPGSVDIRPAKIAVGPRRRRRTSADPVFYRFDPRSTVREVIALLLGAVQRGAQLPNVLGITATSRFAAVVQADFNVAFCHPLDDRTERALARVLSPQEPEEEEPWPPPPGKSTMPPVDRKPERPELTFPKQPPPQGSRPSIFPLWILWLAIGIVGVGCLFILPQEIWRDAPFTSKDPSLPVEKMPASGDTSAPEISVHEERSTEVVLDEVRERLEECKQLRPDALRQSSGFVAAETIEVLLAYQDNRSRVQQAYSALIKIRDRMVKRQGNYIAYYYDEAGKDAAPATRLKKIAEILGEAPLGSEDCAAIRDAFGFEFENEESVVRQWCDTLGRLEKTAGRSFSVPLKQKKGGE